MTLTIAKQPIQPIEKGVWEMADDFSQSCDSCGRTIIRYDAFLSFRKQHGSLCIDCAAPLKRGSERND